MPIQPSPPSWRWLDRSAQRRTPSASPRRLSDKDAGRPVTAAAPLPPPPPPPEEGLKMTIDAYADLAKLATAAERGR